MSHEIATYDPEMTTPTFRSVCPGVDSGETGTDEGANLRRQHSDCPYGQSS